MKNQSLSQTSMTFESIKRVSDSGDDSWSARELARVLDYSEFRHFLPSIEKAKEACTQKVDDHFEQFLDMVEIGSGEQCEMMAPKGGREPSPGMSPAIPWVHTPIKIQHPNGVRELVVRGEEVGG